MKFTLLPYNKQCVPALTLLLPRNEIETRDLWNVPAQWNH